MPIPNKDKLWAQLEAAGEQKVREKLASGVYGSDKVRLIKEWLRRETEQGAKIKAVDEIEMRLIFLRKVYEITGGYKRKVVSREELFDCLDIEAELADRIDRYLYDEGLINWPAMRMISITHDGIKKIESTYNNKEVKHMPDNKNVFVVHGRDSRLRNDLFSFLRALGLQPIEWSEASKLTGKSTPYVGEILDAAFKEVQAVIVLLTPDDEVRLSPELWQNREEENEKEIRLQARPNVLFEAGMAFGTHPDRTLLVEVGQVKAFSDVAGRHVVRLSDSADKRNEIANRLETAGCDVSKRGHDWLSVGNFEVQRKIVESQEESAFPLPKWLKGEDVMKYYNLSQDVLMQCVQKGLPVYRAGADVIFLDEEVPPLNEEELAFDVDSEDYSEFRFKKSDIEMFIRKPQN